MLKSFRALKNNVFHIVHRNYSIGDPTFRKRKLIFDPFYKYTMHGEKPRTQIGGRYHVTMLKGSGSGPEMMEAVESIFECAGVPVVFDSYELPASATEKDFQNVMLSMKRCGACIKAFVDPADKKDASELPSRNMRIRKELELYANLMHFRTLEGLPGRGKPLDLILVRQNVEGEYSTLEHEPVPGMVEHLKIVTRYNTERLAKFAFEMAKRSERNRIICPVVIGATPELFVTTLFKVAEDYPDIHFETMSSGGALHNIILHPETEDVILCESLYGGVIANCIFGMLGSPGLVAGCNYGDRYAMFEPAARAKARTVANKGIVNPTAALLCGVQLLRYLDLCSYADMIETAVVDTIQCDGVLTQDVGGTATTVDFVKNVMERLKETSPRVTVCSLDEEPKLPPPPTTPTPPYDPEYHDLPWLSDPGKTHKFGG